MKKYFHSEQIERTKINQGTRIIAIFIEQMKQHNIFRADQPIAFVINVK